MSTQMPTLFDDQEFYVPPPKKTAKSSKDKVVEPKVEEDKAVALTETLTPEVELPETTVTTDVVALEDGLTESETPHQEIEIVEDFQEPFTQKEPEPTPMMEEAKTTISESISFEIPEIEEPLDLDTPEEANSDPLPNNIPGIKEEVVDDLDQLYRSEIITQDYSAFAGFSFEQETPQKKNIIPHLEESQNIAETEKSTIAIQNIDTENLDFDFEVASNSESQLPNFNLEDRYYTIGEVATLFDVNVSHIRFWTSEFKLKVRTTRKGDRLYNPENIARLRLIHHLVKENKFTIKGAKEKLKTQKKNVSTQIDLKDKLTGLKDKLERIKRNL